VSTIEQVGVEGFRSIRSTNVTLPPMGALIGANGAGKSNFVLALSLLSYLESGSLRNFVLNHGASANGLFHRGSKHTPAMSIDLVVRDDEGRLGYRVTLRAAGDMLAVADEAVAELSDSGVGTWVTLTSNSAGSALAQHIAGQGAAGRVRRVLQRCKHLHVHDTSRDSPLRSVAKIEDGRYLRSNGSNLAAYLYKLHEDTSDTGRAAWLRVLELTQRVAPFIKELLPTPVRGDHGAPPASGPVRLDWIDELDDVYSVEHLSDGTLRALAIITMLAQPADALPRLLVIDEPELGLHPLALSLVCELARSVSTRCQIILATQAPAVLEHVRPDEVLVADRVDGSTRLRRLEPETLKDWTSP
jgi:predicted ATPase